MPLPLIPDDSFPPGRNEPCFCGSGERFKHCCGVRTPDRLPPHGLGIMDAFLSPEECQQLVSLANSIAGERFKLRDLDWNLTNELDPTRVCELMQLGDSQKLLDDLVARAFTEQVLPHTGQQIDWYEEPQLLRYQSGGFYQYHVDAYDPVPNGKAWRKAIDRDISILIYLNDNFTGGELEFKRFSYFLQPKAGMLVWFPSDIRYEHMARPVTSGYRYAVVSWAAVTGVERVRNERPRRSIDWATREKQATGLRLAPANP